MSTSTYCRHALRLYNIRVDNGETIYGQWIQKVKYYSCTYVYISSYYFAWHLPYYFLHQRVLLFNFIAPFQFMNEILLTDVDVYLWLDDAHLAGASLP